MRKIISRLFRVFSRLLLIIASFVGVFTLISIALAKAMQQKEVRNRIRRFNHERLNPLVLKIAGNGSGIYASLHHVGRRSGRAYVTPVVAKRLGDGFVIPLPYGANVDWCRNVLAAGVCTLRWNEQEYALEKPEIVKPADALDAYPLLQRFIFAAGGLKQYLWLHERSVVREKVAAGL